MISRNSDDAKNDSDGGRPISPEEVYTSRDVITKAGKRVGWDDDSCEDVVQELVVKCLTNPKIRFNPLKGSLDGYLYRIAVNTAKDMRRKDKHLPIPVEDVELVAMLEAEAPDMEDEELQEKRRRLMNQGIEEMYRRYPSKNGNDAFVMFSRDGMSAKQVAEKLCVTEKFVGLSVHRGKKRLAAIVRRMEQDENWRDAC